MAPMDTYWASVAKDLDAKRRREAAAGQKMEYAPRPLPVRAAHHRSREYRRRFRGQKALCLGCWKWRKRKFFDLTKDGHVRSRCRECGERKRRKRRKAEAVGLWRPSVAGPGVSPGAGGL